VVGVKVSQRLGSNAPYRIVCYPEAQLAASRHCFARRVDLQLRVDLKGVTFSIACCIPTGRRDDEMGRQHVR